MHGGSSSVPAAADEQQQQQQQQQQQRRRLPAVGVAMTLCVALLLLVLVVCGPAPAAAFLLPASSPVSAAPGSRRALAGTAAATKRLVQWAAAEGDDMGPQTMPKGFGKKAGTKKPAAEAAAAEAGPEETAKTPEELARLSARQKMAYWEIQKELEREMDLAEIEEYKETQRLLDEGVVGYLPEKISNRMLKRLIPFISMPLLGAAAMFGFYLYLSKNTDIDVPPAFVAFSTQVPFLGALAGITYSIMSTSWDPDVEGSFWGVNEFKANVLNLLESLQKSKREERAKEKMKKYERAPAMNRAKRREVDRLTK